MIRQHLPHTKHILSMRGGFFMIDHDDAYQEDRLSIGKGLIVGVVFGSLIWAGIITGIVYMW